MVLIALILLIAGGLAWRMKTKVEFPLSARLGMLQWVGLVLGAVVNMEQKMKNGAGVTEEDIRRFKKIVAPATGSSGDWLFWSNLRPFALVSGISCAPCSLPSAFHSVSPWRM